jgi:hypothetical protein
MRDFSLEIHFPVSRSKNYQNVVKNARLFFGFSENPNILRITDINELFGRWDNFSIVIFGATKWSGTNVFFCGKPVIPYRNEFFYKLLDLKHCYLSRQSCIDRAGHCTSSDWGCRKLTHLSRSIGGLYSQREFYKVGFFKDPTTWIIDKERIFTNLLTEAEIRLVNICPGFSLDNIRIEVENLPDQIDVNVNWQVTYRTEVNSSGIVRVPVDIDYIDPEVNIEENIQRKGLTFKLQTELNSDDDTARKDDTKAIDDFLDHLLEQRKKKDDDKWEKTSF